MYSLQLHKFAYKDVSANVGNGNKTCLDTGWHKSLLKHNKTTHVQEFRPTFRIYASSRSVPYKEIVNSGRTFSGYSSASVLKVVEDGSMPCQLALGLGFMALVTWIIHCVILREEDTILKESKEYRIIRSYQPLVLWIVTIIITRAFDPLVLAAYGSLVVDQQMVYLVRFLSAALAFAYCKFSLIKNLHKLMVNRRAIKNTGNFAFQLDSNAFYAPVVVIVVCLLLKFLGFSAQKGLSVKGLGTVILTLAGREIFTNFVSSVMIHMTRPFVRNEWIQINIDGCEVSGTVEHVGWLSPTIVRGDDREAVHIPNKKLTVNVVRNLTQRSHWRIKTYFGISHVDVCKILTIIDDMRMVISKHPLVDQRLHRRVFLENVDSEKHALMVLVSCFVKTPHFEEYLHAKEVIFLELLQVISDHNARLAIPVRSLQRINDEVEPHDATFGNINLSSEQQWTADLLTQESITEDGDNHDLAEELPSLYEKDVSDLELYVTENHSLAQTHHVRHKLEGLESLGLHPDDITLLGAAFEKPPAKALENLDNNEVDKNDMSFNSSSGLEGGMPSDKDFFQSQDPDLTVPGGNAGPGNNKKLTCLESSKAGSAGMKTQLKDNLVLGVALDGPKRTLPIDSESKTTTYPVETSGIL